MPVGIVSLAFAILAASTILIEPTVGFLFTVIAGVCAIMARVRTVPASGSRTIANVALVYAFAIPVLAAGAVGLWFS